jgi:aerobic carbon-monoxide dehydrogenase medium subunit
VKAAAFNYQRASSTQEALALLQQHGDAAKLLAGGQTLIATLNMRLSEPSLLIDVSELTELRGITLTSAALRIGALTTHRQIECSALVATHAPLLTQAAPHIAHIAIRNVGTLGGSLAFADPAAEWPVCAVALNATIIVIGQAGERRIAAREFFTSLYETLLQPSEMIVACEFPLQPPNTRNAFLELSRRQGDYGIVAVAATAQISTDVEPNFRNVQLSYLGMGLTPVLARGAMAALEGQTLNAERIGAINAALSSDLDPTDDLYTKAETKQHLARVLTLRALRQIASGVA